MINTKEMLVGVDGHILTEPVLGNASLRSEFTPHTLYQTRKMEEECRTNISFPEDLSEYQRFMAIQSLSDLVEAIEGYDFGAILVELHKNLKWFDRCTSNYTAFLDDVKLWTTGIQPAYDEPGANFIYEEEANPIHMLAELYESNILNPYKENKVTKLQLRNILIDAMTADIINSAETLQNSITAKYDSTMRELISNVRLVFKKIYTNALQYLAAFQIYFPDKQGTFLTRAQGMKIWQIPTVTLDATGILSFQISENESWRVWTQYMDIQYFVDNQINNAFKVIDISVFGVIEDTLGSIDRLMLDKVTAIDSELLKTEFWRPIWRTFKQRVLLTMHLCCKYDKNCFLDNIFIFGQIDSNTNMNDICL